MNHASHAATSTRPTPQARHAEFHAIPVVVLGLVGSAAWGWYIALVFGPLYNFFSARAR